MQFILALLTGLAVGVHNATWGMYKDAPHEGFTWSTYFRSVIAGVIYGPLLWYIFKMDMTNCANIFLLFGAAYSLERITMEVYKTFIRVEDQSKYFIPMQLSVFGKPVESYPARLLFGLLYVVALTAISYGIWFLNAKYQSGNLNISPFLLLLPCSVFGWVSAFGGAWKDAPLEGFETFKFFRSPGVAYFFAFVASIFSSNLLIITMCSIGFTIASIETYKTFFFLDRPRGKFQGKPITHPEIIEFRKKFVPIYIGIWALVIFCFICGFFNRPESLLPF
ncbi:MAG: hypothetical protein ACJA01_004188 [Saprospiraceae bacterium]|jgi:hypothetical protein